MPKTSPASIVTALAQDHLGEAYLAIRMDLSTPVYLWTGFGTVTIDGNSYIGAGDLLQFESVAESSELGAEGVRVVFTGANSDLLTAALTEDYQQRDAYIYFGLTTAPDDEQLLFSGYMDTLKLDDSAELATITLTIENRLRDLQRARPRRYTNEDQQAAYPGDTFFGHVAAIQDVRIPWGRDGDVGPPDKPWGWSDLPGALG